MEQMEEKLGAILGNPQLMQQIMEMAKSLNQSTAASPPQVPSELKQDHAANTGSWNLDPSMIQNILDFAGKTKIDSNEASLLQALSPYLQSERLHKLEKAMRATKLANTASSILPLLTGR